MDRFDRSYDDIIIYLMHISTMPSTALLGYHSNWHTQKNESAHHWSNEC